MGLKDDLGTNSSISRLYADGGKTSDSSLEVEMGNMKCNDSENSTQTAAVLHDSRDPRLRSTDYIKNPLYTAK